MKSASLVFALLLCACSTDQGMLPGPPPPAAGLPAIAGASTLFGPIGAPGIWGPAVARIDGTTFFINVEGENRRRSLFSRRVSYQRATRTLTSEHRDLDLAYDVARGAFVGHIKHPRTRERLMVEVSFPESGLP